MNKPTLPNKSIEFKSSGPSKVRILVKLMKNSEIYFLILVKDTNGIEMYKRVFIHIESHNTDFNMQINIYIHIFFEFLVIYIEKGQSAHLYLKTMNSCVLHMV